MFPTHRRARRALIPLVLAATATAVGPGPGPGLDAAGPRVTVRVKQRTLVVEGSRADEVIRLSSPAATPFSVVVTLGLEDPRVVATVHRDRFDQVVVRAGDGNDHITVDETPGISVPFTDTTPTVLRGEAGDDVLAGGSGAEQLGGDAGFDIVDGNGGDDTISLGADNDQVIWDPGDGSDTVDGGAGSDGMSFNGAPINETFAAVADGRRLRLTRVQGSIVMDVDGVEEVSVNTLGGSDFTEVDDLTGTDVVSFNVDDGQIAGGDGPDGVIDTVVVSGTRRADLMTLTGAGTITDVVGPATAVRVVDMDRLDSLLVVGDRGGDTIDATGVAADAVRLSLLSGDGADVVLGGAGADVVLAGAGRDVVDANGGNDDIDLDAGDDTIVWDPGDGGDLVDGAAGFDTMTVNGSDDDEVMEAVSRDDELVVARDLGLIGIVTERLEQLDVNALGGTDALTVGDLSGTTIELVTLDLAAAPGTVGGDGASDRVVARGTPFDDLISAAGAGGAARIEHLPWTIDIVNSEPADTLVLDGNGGDDVIDTSGLGPDTIQPALLP